MLYVMWSNPFECFVFKSFSDQTAVIAISEKDVYPVIPGSPFSLITPYLQKLFDLQMLMFEMNFKNLYFARNKAVWLLTCTYCNGIGVPLEILNL